MKKLVEQFLQEAIMSPSFFKQKLDSIRGSIRLAQNNLLTLETQYLEYIAEILNDNNFECEVQEKNNGDFVIRLKPLGDKERRSLKKLLMTIGIAEFEIIFSEMLELSVDFKRAGVDALL